MARALLVILLCATAFPGCAVHEVHKDHDLIRTTLLDLYTNQIMDNLVRAANDMPIIQVDYSQATAMVTITNNIGGMETQATTANNLLTLPASTLAATRTIMTTLTGNASSMNANQVTIQAAPLITDDDVYDAYFQFLAEPDTLRITDCAPPPGEAHMCKKQGGKYYWIPKHARGLFMKLALQTTAQRGKAALQADEFFTVTLQTLLEDRATPSGKFHTLTYQLGADLPAGIGYLTLDNDNNKEQFDIQVTATKSNQIKFNMTDDRYKAVLSGLPQTGKVFLLHKRPAVPTTAELINRVNYNLQQIQFNQLRQPGG